MNEMYIFVTVATLLVIKSFGEALNEGDNCILRETDKLGKCIKANDCDEAKKLIKQNKIPQHCGFRDIRIPLVCCPKAVEILTNSSTTRRISEEKCKEYHHVHRPTLIIAFGTNATVNEFPHMAAIGYENHKNILWLCGGSLISPRFILSAAHCSISREFGDAKWVRLGDLDLKNSSDGAHPLDIKILNIFNHPQYKPPSHYNDIVLFKIEKSIIFGTTYKPACLYNNENVSIDKLEVAGWGKTDYLGDASNHLLKATLNLISHKECSKIYSTVSPRKLSRGIDNESQICAGDSSGKDTCPGDSGGPLHFKKPAGKLYQEHFVIVGITSFGKGCGLRNSVGVYTRVSSYIGWIESIVWS